MKRTIYTVSFALALTIASILPGAVQDPVSASDLSELQKQKEQLNQEKTEVNAEINQAEEKINSIQNEQVAVETEKKRLDLAIGDANTKILQKSQEIEVKNGEIQQLQTEIVQISDRINKRNEMLKDRARSFQENGGRVTYIDVLMGAESFGDFIDRVGAVATILEADQDILRQHKEDKQLLEEKKVQVETELASLENMKKELEALKIELSGKIAQQEQLLASLEQKEEEAHAEKLEFAEQAELLAAQQAAIQKAIKLEEQRLASEAEAARQNNQSPQANPSGGGGGGPSPAVSNGFWTSPAVGTFTSGLGIRWGSYHAGIDIANRVSVPIVAAADGVVIRSYSSPSYGEAIFIAHYMNGQVYTTVYAHMNTRLAGSGAVVKKGDTIGYMGNTGDSTGQHLHFELHAGEWNSSKSNAVDPYQYIPR